MLGLRADEGDLVLVENFGEARVFGQEAIARMDGVGAGDLAGGHDCGDVEIGSRAGGGPMQTLSSASLTCIASLSAVEWTATVAMPSSFAARMTRSAISPRLAIRILSNIETRSGTPVQCPSLDNHERLAVFDRRPVLDRMLTTFPALGATMSLKVFIASTSRSLSPAFTVAPISTKGLDSGFGLR